ncbi:F0F1 ATP synthase subunit delta [Companilactobacillus allii]|uniref:ATP synthase subunit delta n=1 Tax=Companilactobacillus allii TaxID=1847728 RepID=A0A1P8Q5G6_9LACO|nr:F0F1 ATP synthase subunit delta [Companilactobacillus allii]APX73086.1 F0F1 ATP synthase subunit delta [Companilactobacillus allii]USQ67888.1 F0F1 ATP synthase subunit delta [Companilactobacillus allii]
MKLSKFQVGKRYSRALYEVAVEQDSVDNTLQELKKLSEVFSENPGLNIAFSGRAISRTEKLKIVNTLKTGASELMQDFVGMLFDRDRLNCLEEITDAYVERYDTEHGIVEVTVTSVIDLTSEQEDKLKSVVKQRFSVNQVNLTKIVDPSIIGGIVVRVGDQVIDGSVVKRFNDVKKLLLVNN